MNSQTEKNEAGITDPWGSFEPYVQLVPAAAQTAAPCWSAIPTATS